MDLDNIIPKNEEKKMSEQNVNKINQFDQISYSISCCQPFLNNSFLLMKGSSMAKLFKNRDNIHTRLEADFYFYELPTKTAYQVLQVGPVGVPGHVRPNQVIPNLAKNPFFLFLEGQIWPKSRFFINVCQGNLCG